MSDRKDSVVSVLSGTSINFAGIIEAVDRMAADAANRINALTEKAKQGNPADRIGEMLGAQLSMNGLHTTTEYGSSVVAAVNGAMNTVARNIKG